MDEIRRKMRQITRMAQSYTGKALKHSDLNASETVVLRTVIFNQNITQQELADMLDIDKAAVARLLRGLEKKAYIIRKADENDGRIKRAMATTAGKAANAESIAAEIDFYKWIFRGAEEAELSAMLKTLESAFAEAKLQKADGFKTLLSKGVHE